MFGRFFSAGLPLSAGPAPDPAGACPLALTEEAALVPDHGEELRVEPLAAEDSLVAQGQPLLRLRAAPGIVLAAPMAGRVAALTLQPGRRLVQMVLFREPGGGRHRHDIAGAEGDPAALRALMQGAGLWRMLRSRPFGGMPGPEEIPAAIFVMAADTRPGAPVPRRALEGRTEDFLRGLHALSRLAGALFLVEGSGPPLAPDGPPGLRRLRCGPLHPQGLAGIQIHRHRPASAAARVWDLHAEDAADLGALLATGLLPETRLVSVTGPALRMARLVRTSPGADLRGLSHGHVRPGPHELLSGPALGGHPAHWLGPRDRQASVLPRGADGPRRHWFGAALRSAARPLPVVPTAALEQALGGALPAAALVRALASGDGETAARLGALSLLPEDLALADYVTAAEPPLSRQLAVLLSRIRAEEAPE